MDAIVSIKEFKADELHFLHVLKELSKICQHYEKRPHSLLDPVSTVTHELRLIEASTITILSKHINFFEKLDIFCVMSKEIEIIIESSELIDAYEQLLSNGINIILNPNVTLFRTGDMSLVDYVIQVYQRLVTYESFSTLTNITKGFIRVRQLISNLESTFFSKYKLLNNNNLRFEKVYDILSHSPDMVQSSRFNVINIEQHTAFRLNKTKFNEDTILVDLCQLNTGELAIFKINSGKLPTIFKSGKDLLTELSAKNRDLLNVGRTLLFQPLKPNDLQIVKYSGTSIELKTCTANNVVLKLVCMDPLKWPVVWKPYFERLFSIENKRTQISKKRSFPKLPIPDTPIEQTETNIEKKPTLDVQGHKGGPLTSIPHLQNEPSTCNSQNSGPSLKDIESLSYEKLIELDRSIQMNLSPALAPSPEFGKIKDESQLFSVDEIVTNGHSPSIRPSNNNETDDIESLISFEGEIEESPIRVSTNSIFHPTVEEYKPTLHTRKSHSLLSLFATKNKPNVSIDTFESEHTSFFSSADSSNVNTPQSDSPNYATPLNRKTSLAIPVDVDLSYSITEQDIIKVTRWDGKKWEIIGPKNMQITISRVSNKYIALTMFLNKEKTECAFIIKISANWKCFRSTAQDIQLKIPASDFIASIMNLKDSYETLTIRCVKVENLMNSLLYCINSIVPVSLSTSSTIRTLSTTMSSYFSDTPKRSSAYQSYLCSGKNDYAAKESNSLLLIASIKAKRHARIEQKWQPQDIGSLDIFSQESQNVRTGVKFDFISDKNNNLDVANKLQFSNELNQIKRQGRTGIIVSNEDRDDQLFEFTSNIVAEQVYKLIQGA